MDGWRHTLILISGRRKFVLGLTKGRCGMGYHVIGVVGGRSGEPWGKLCVGISDI